MLIDTNHARAYVNYSRGGRAPPVMAGCFFIYRANRVVYQALF